VIALLATLLALSADPPAKAPAPSGKDAAASQNLPPLSEEDRAIVEHLELLERLELLEHLDLLDTSDEEKRDGGGKGKEGDKGGK